MQVLRRRKIGTSMRNRGTEKHKEWHLLRIGTCLDWQSCRSETGCWNVH